MNDLPRAFVPWAEHLDLLPRELALSFGPMVARLDALIGAAHRAPNAGSEEPDGFDGLARRGSYERLLLSEWLLAEEAPDEFLRRAATGEHAFHRLAHRDPAASRTCVALFDAGPNQLGSPRLAHLAAIIVLARRAQSSGARFVWGVLQKPSELFETVSAATIRAWLHGRGAGEATADHFSQWQNFLAQGAATGAEADVWIAGGHRLPCFDNLSAARLLVRDVLEPDVRQLEIETHQRGRAGRSALLDLPEEAACARLLRDPFAGATAEIRRAPGGMAPQSNFLWGSGNKLLARTESGALIVWSVPGSASAEVGKPKLYHPQSNGEIIAAGRIRKAIVLAVRTSPNTISIEAIGKKRTSLPRGEFRLNAPLPTENPSPLLPCLMPLDSRHLHICLPNQQMMKVLGNAEGNLQSSKTESMKKTVAAAEWGEYLVHVSVDNAESRIIAESEKATTGALAAHPLPSVPLSAFHGYAADGGYDGFGLWAIETDERRWHVVSKAGDETLVAPVGTRVVGVVQHPSCGPTPGLVVIEADNRTISLLGRTWTHKLPQSAAPISHASVCATAPLIAFSTSAGETAVYSLIHNTHLMRFEASGT